MSPRQSSKERHDDALQAGRGFLIIAGAKVYFILTSAGIALGLPRLLGDPALFGEFKVVSALITIFNMVLITGTIQTVSRLTAASPGNAWAVGKAGLTVSGTLGTLAAAGLVALATPISAWAFQDASLAPYVRIGAGVVFFYSLYAVFVGLINGLQRFGLQARVDMLFSTLKVVLIVGAVVLGLGVAGAFIGFVVAAGTTVLLAAAICQRRIPRTKHRASLRELLILLGPILLSTLMLNLLLQLDMLAIKGLLAAPIRDALQADLPSALAAVGLDALPDSASGAKVVGDRLAGFFGGAKNLALLPYQATFALTFVVFPMLSKTVFSGDLVRARTYITQSLRFTLLVAGALCATLMGVAGESLGVVFGPSYAIAGQALVLLLGATVCFSLLVLSITMLIAAGAERRAVLLTSLTVLAVAGLQVALLTTTPSVGSEALTRSAAATLMGSVVGLALGLRELRSKFAAKLPVASLWRVLAAGAGVVALSRVYVAQSAAVLVLKTSALGLLFLLGVVMLGELSSEDRRALWRIAGRQRQ